MTDRELLEQILSNQQKMQSDITDMRSDITDMRSDITNMQGDITDIRLHLENVTDRNISLLVENYSNLVKKLDENNSVTDQQIAYQIRVNYLMEDVEKLKKEVAELKNKIA